MASKPDSEYWKEIGFNLKTIFDKHEPDLDDLMVFKNRKYLNEFYKKYTGKEGTSHTITGFLEYLLREKKELAKILFLVSEYSSLANSWYVKKHLEVILDVKNPKGTNADLSLLLFVHKPELLKVIRALGIGKNVRKENSYLCSTVKIEKKKIEDKEIKKIEKIIKTELASSDKRAELHSNEYDKTENKHLFNIRYEKNKKKVEQWDGPGWIKPVNWMFVEYYFDSCKLSIKSKNEKKEKIALDIFSELITKKKDAFEPIKIGYVVKNCEDIKPELIEKSANSDKDFEIKNIVLTYFEFSGVQIKNIPIICIDADKVNETVTELKKEKKLDLFQLGTLTKIKFRVTYEENGIQKDACGLANYKTNGFTIKSRLKDKYKTLIRHKVDQIMGYSDA